MRRKASDFCAQPRIHFQPCDCKLQPDYSHLLTEEQKARFTEHELQCVRTGYRPSDIEYDRALFAEKSAIIERAQKDEEP